MKILFSILFIIFSSPIIADDISDFQIEGMSIGETLLDFISESEIQKNIEIDKYDDDKYYTVGLYNKGFKTYDGVQITLKTGDKDYIIQGLDGGIFYDDNFEKCLMKKKDMVKDITLMLDKNISSNENVINHPADKSGNSKIYTYEFYLNNSTSDNYSDSILVYCTNWSIQLEKKYNWTDNLRVSLSTREFNYWYNNQAYK